MKSIVTSRLLKMHAFFGGNALISILMGILIALAIATAALLFFYTGTPTTMTIAGGPPGSSLHRFAEQYQKILKREGITLKIVTSEGSLDNLHKLEDPKSGVDVAFVLGGDADGRTIEHLQSLGSISYQPLMVFYSGPEMQKLGDFKGKRLALGEDGSGEHRLAMTLLKANGIDGKEGTSLIDMSAADAVKALADGRIDGMFFMSESGSTDVIKELTHNPNIHVLNFAQADAYVRRINYLNKLSLPRGAFDFGQDLPPQDVTLLGPMVELIARDNLHPALSDFLIDAAKQTHGNPGFFKKRGEFPVPLEHEFKISPDATRYYASGKSYMYRTFPFWMARMINRMVVAIVPVILVLIPGLKIIPAVYRWRMQGRIYRWYRELLELERAAFEPNLDMATRDALLQKLWDIEESVKTIRVPATFADLFYSLREHIVFVRERLIEDRGPNASL